MAEAEDIAIKRIDDAFRGVGIYLGETIEGEEAWLVYDYSSVALNPHTGKWELGAIWFNVMIGDKVITTAWKQPVIRTYKSPTFEPKIISWMVKKYNLKSIDNHKVSDAILKVAKKASLSEI